MVAHVLLRQKTSSSTAQNKALHAIATEVSIQAMHSQAMHKTSLPGKKELMLTRLGANPGNVTLAALISPLEGHCQCKDTTETF